MKILKYFG